MPDKMLALIAAPDEIAGILASLDRYDLSPCPMDQAALCDGIGSGELAAAVVSDTMMGDEDWRQIADAVARQPAWSDFPIVLIAESSMLDGRRGAIEQLGNVSLVARPADPAVLASAVRTALRARARQQPGSEVDARTTDLVTENARFRTLIEGRKRAESRLRESEELHRFTVELSGRFAWTASAEGRIISVSPGFVKVTGLAADTDPHEGFLEVIHPDDLATLLARWENTRAARRTSASEFRMRMADGSYRMFRTHAMPRFDDKGALVRWYGITEDVQGEKESEAARRAAEERYHLAVMATNDAIWDYEVATGLVHWADTASEALGFDAELGSTPISWWEERVHPEDREKASSDLQKAIETGGERWTATYRFRAGSGEYRTYFDRGFVIRDELGEAVQVVGAMADISQRQHAEEEMRRMQAELIHVSRLSAMGTMASTLAHELNQPLTAVTSYLRGARHLLEHGSVTEMGRICEALSLAESGALRAGQIVRRLRDLVAKGTAAMRPEELPKLIEDAGAIAFLDAHLHEVTRHFDLDPAAQWVEVDRIQIQQVLINLVRNAMQAMQNVSARDITIRTRRVSPVHAEVAVIDTGCGIPAEVREALFSPFQGTKAEGLGIGLSISRTIVEAHGGKIWAEDRKGGGAIFCFTVPASEQDVRGSSARQR